jgi:hypothetical protein
MVPSTLIIFIVCLCLIASVPIFPWSTGWGIYPASGLGLVLVVVLILVLLRIV